MLTKLKFMKTKFTTLVLCMFFMLHGNAQSDGFFNSNGFGGRETYQTHEEVSISNMNIDAAPLGSGSLLLVGFGLAYASFRRKEVVR